MNDSEEPKPTRLVADAPTIVTALREREKPTRCPPARRIVATMFDAGRFNALDAATVVYGWNLHGSGLVESCRQTRNIIRMQNRGAWRPAPDPLFDFLHTNFGKRWRLILLRSKSGTPVKLKVVFERAEDLTFFLGSWHRGICPLRATELDNIIQWPI